MIILTVLLTIQLITLWRCLNNHWFNIGQHGIKEGRSCRLHEEVQVRARTEAQVHTEVQAEALTGVTPRAGAATALTAAEAIPAGRALSETTGKTGP